MTYRELIIHILTCRADKLTCAELSKRVVSDRNLIGSTKKQINSTLSGILNKLVRADILQYDDSKGPKGGYVYKIKKI